MKLYHGTNTDFDVIDLAKSNKYKDFGQGFYSLSDSADIFLGEIVTDKRSPAACAEFDIRFGGTLSNHSSAPLLFLLYFFIILLTFLFLYYIIYTTLSP